MRIHHNNTNVWTKPPLKFALIVVNTYEGSSKNLGPAPYNNALLCKENFEKLGYFVNIMLNPSVLEFDALLFQSLLAVNDSVVVYYYGHCTKAGCLQMKNGDVNNERIRLLVDKSRRCKNLTFMFDTCFSEKLVFPGVNVIASASSNEEAHQKKFEGKEYGVFTYFFWKFFYEKHFERLLSIMMKKYSQTYVIRGQKETLF